MATLLLVRHGETEWNTEGRIQGWAPVGLSDRGHQQADQVSTYLADQYDVDLIVSSDLQRTMETAEPIASAVGQPIEKNRKLRERHFGVYQGLLSESFFNRFPKMDLLENGRGAVEYTPESGESWLDLRERVFEAVSDLRNQNKTIVVVTHVNPIRLILGDLMEKDIISSLTELSVENCSLTEIRPDGDVGVQNRTVFLSNE